VLYRSEQLVSGNLIIGSATCEEAKMDVLRKLLGRDLESQLAKMPEEITTVEQSRTAYRLANAFYDKGDYNRAIAIYDRLLSGPASSLINTYEVRKSRAMAYCKASRFGEAEKELTQLLNVLKSQGASVTNSQVMYWYLVARYQGDERKAMDEFVNM
jgi:tetratricopeptide (TPR) repeat protein